MPSCEPSFSRLLSCWQRIQALPAGVSINIKAKTSQTGCKLKSVDAGSLTCTHGKDIVFQRSEILTVKTPSRGRSALIGMAIGAGGGAIVGVSLGRNGSFVGRGAGAVIVAVPGAVIGAVVGALTNSSHHTIYTAPAP
jgi:uncharacterized protein YcfJ